MEIHVLYIQDRENKSSFPRRLFMCIKKVVPQPNLGSEKRTISSVFSKLLSY